MIRPMELKTTDEQFDSLHAALAKKRASTTEVKINAAALANVLADYAKLVEMVGGSQ